MIKKRANLLTRITALTLSAALISVALTACATGLNFNTAQKEATNYTKEINNAVYALLDFDDEQEREFAERGLLAAPEALELLDENGDVIWSQKAFAFVENTDAPDTANPSLWRNAQLNHLYGLFEVTEGIYQVRGYDLSNITFIKGDTGWIVFDPLTNVEPARAALNLINETLGERPVTGVVISHSHADHFGGIRGVVADDNIPIIAPEGFEEHAVSENIYAGNAMLRRSDYMYGRNLEVGERDRLSVGLGIGVPRGTSSYISPNDIIKETGEVRVIDGVTMEFQLTPGTEAPAEMNTWFPAHKALWAAENCTGTLHNLYTLRGAQVRDGNAWAYYIMEAVTLYGKDAEVIFQSHNWPHWGNGIINEYLTNTAAMYKFINDQTLLYINQGYTANEISNMIKLPEALDRVWYTRQYYGTLSHNARAVYQRYMGWYDANPAHLNPLSPTDSAKKMVEYMGDAKKVLRKAKEDFYKGEYRWVAEITMILVFADPKNKDARYLCADALEQLGYQAESGVWRAAYLTGAKELREGTPTNTKTSMGRLGEMLRAMESYMVFDYMGIHLDSNAAQDLNMKINFNVTGDADYLVTVKSGVLLYQKNASAADADATVTLPKQAVALLLSPESDENGLIEIEGDTAVLQTLAEHMAEFEPIFNIIEP
ncbi:MAG: MBL fold metallo-hydrolase [Oscillospiraceae bacterium]|nr:MBL fold metallo-hydrolase [Oscillospiraceae bacterium]